MKTHLYQIGDKVMYTDPNSFKRYVVIEKLLPMIGMYRVFEPLTKFRFQKHDGEQFRSWDIDINQLFKEIL